MKVVDCLNLDRNIWRIYVVFTVSSFVGKPVHYLNHDNFYYWFKETVSLISSDALSQDGNVWFTSAPLKAFSNQAWIRYSLFCVLKCIFPLCKSLENGLWNWPWKLNQEIDLWNWPLKLTSEIDLGNWPLKLKPWKVT